jgi:HK97 family phage major capsid protein
MLKKILELKQKRANLTTQIRGIIDEFESKEMDQTKKDELRNLEAEFDKVNEEIVIKERQLERERLAGQSENPEPVQSARNEEAEKKDKDEKIRAAFINHLREGSVHSYQAYRDLAMDNPTQAGYIVAPEQFVNQMIQDLNNILFMRQICKVLPPLKGAHSLGYPVKKTRMSSFTWGTELAAPSKDTSLSFGKREFRPNPGTSEILVSKNLIRHAPNADGIVRDEINYDVGTGLETAYMTGDGVGKPLGIFTASADGIPTTRDVSEGNTATEVKFDGLKSAKYSLKEQYLRSLNLSWIFHRDCVKKLAKLKDADGQYIWQQNVSASEPDMLLSIPLRMSEYCPNTFSSAQYVGILGDFSHYWIVDSLNLEIQVLTELYARTNQIDYITRLETDGTPVTQEAFARVKLG